MSYDVFISYSHHDKATADAICAGLEQDGIRCWYAPRDISPGADWAESIIKAIESVKVMVLIYTEQSNMSRQVLNELSNAVSTGTIVIPFRLTDLPPSKGLQYYFASVHWLDATNAPIKNSIDQLKTLIHGILMDKPAEKQIAETKQPEPETIAPAGRGKKIAAILAGLLLLAAACVLLLPRVMPGNTSVPTEPAESVGPLPWPENGEIWRAETTGETNTECTFRVHQPSTQAVVIRILENDEVPISTLFIGGDSSAVVSLPEGVYSIRYAWGQEWYGLEELVTSGIFLQVTFGEDDENLVRLDADQEYMITLNLE